MLRANNRVLRNTLATIVASILLFAGTGCVTTKSQTTMREDARLATENTVSRDLTPWRYRRGAQLHTRPLRKGQAPCFRCGPLGESPHNAAQNVESVGLDKQAKPILHSLHHNG